MKKTLIALAAVAVSSAAMAQVTVSGVVDARYQSIKGDATAADNVSGFLMSDAQVVFTANEDLGNGLTATASFTIDNVSTDSGAGTSATPQTAADTLAKADGVFLRLASPSFGAVTFSSLESGDYLPIDLVTKVSAFSNGTIADRVTYTSPTVGGFRFQATMQEGGAGAGSGATYEAKVYEVDYTNGPLTANVGVLSVDKSVALIADSGTRYKVGYNFGVAAVSYGVVNTKDKDGVKDKETGLAVTVPMGAVTLGAQYSTAEDGSATATYKGTAVSAKYAFSKRTSITAERVQYDEASASDAKRTRVTLSHAF